MWAHATMGLIFAGTIGYVVWDVVAYVRAGGDATESTTVGTWMARSLWVTFAVFLLVGHLCGSGPTFTWRHAVVAFAGLVIGYFCTTSPTS